MIYRPISRRRTRSNAPPTAVVLRVFIAAFFIALGRPADAEHARINEALQTTKLINYYPARHAQARMWTEWDPEQINRDLAAIAGLSANAVRVAVYTEAFGFPEPEPRMLARLNEFIALADRHGLKVKLALFGFFNDWPDIAGSTRWAEAVLKNLKDDRRIAFLDLYNELKLEEPGAIEWAGKLLPVVRKAAGSIPLTISVSGKAGIPGLVALRTGLGPGTAQASVVDFYEFHYYREPTFAFRSFNEARAAVAPVPLYVGEFGYSTQPRSRTPASRYREPWWEAHQAHYFRTIYAAAREANLPPPAPWTFSDYVRGAFRAGSTASDPAEYKMGLQRTDGTRKPAAEATMRYFATGEVDLSFNNGFEARDTSGLPLQWLIWKPELAQFAADSSVARSGSASVRISKSAANPTAAAAFTTSPIKPIQPGTEYRATVWARGHGVTGEVRLGLAWFDAEGKYLSLGTSYNLPRGDSDWRQLEVRTVAPGRAASVEIHLASSGNDGTVWFDDVTFD